MEMRKRIMSLAVLVLMVGFVISATPVVLSSGSGNGKVSKPFEYSGYTSPVFTSFEKMSAYVPMTDGKLIAVDVFTPSGYVGPEPEPTEFPVVFEYTPYGRATIVPYLPYDDIDDASGDLLVQLLLAYGYAFVIADIRGTGASTGWKMDFMPRIAQDGGEVVDWIATQGWCDGNVGMTGGSYVGWSQTATAGQKPEALKCIVPAVIPLEGYTGEVYPGGIYLKGFMDTWTWGMYWWERNAYVPGVTDPGAPVVDEDGDGQLADEIPLDLDASGTFLDDYNPPVTWPQYIDGQPRAHIYYFLTLEHHLGNYIYADWAEIGMYIDFVSPLGYSTYELGPNAFVPDIMDFGLPVYNVGGWFDGFTRGTTELYSTMKTTNPSRMLMFPGFHGLGGPYWEYLGEPFPNLYMETLRYYDHYLKGIENGIDKEPPIYIYVMNGEGWRFEDTWPLPQQVMTNYYFDGGNTLATERDEDGSDDYTANYAHSSMYGTSSSPFVPGVGSNRWLGIAGITPNELLWRTDKDLQCLTYTSEPLTQDMEVTGHPIVQFSVSSTADYGDFFVYLEDVDETGEALYVTEGQLRAGFADLYDNDEEIYSGDYGIDVLPDLPWHGYEELEYVDGILAGGNIVELVFDLLPTSWVFKEGHSIRVSIACSDWPTFRLHEQLCPNNNPLDPANIVPTITVYRDCCRPSCIQLPVIPPKTRVFEGCVNIKTPELTYKGPAELYTFETAVYLHFEDQWIRWETKYHWQFRFMDFYICIGDLGVLWVRVVQRDRWLYAVAMGPGVFFFYHRAT